MSSSMNLRRHFASRGSRRARLDALRRRRPVVERLENYELLATFLVTSTGDSGPGTLRFAINSANTDGNPATINFQIPGTGPQTIQVGVGSGAALPTLHVPTLIDGFSEGVFQGTPNYTGPPLVVIDGSQTPSKNGF